MAIDKHNSLQFLLFGQPSYFEEFGDVDGVYVDRVPFELRARLLRWTWPARNRDQYFFQHAGRDVITREGWEAFVRWVGCAMDRQLGAEYNDPKEAEANTQSVLALKGLVRCPSAPVTTEAMNMRSAQRMEANTVASQASAAVLHAVYALADYPLLASVAATRTQARKLDGRACLHLYKSALGDIDWMAVTSAEKEFMRQLGIFSICPSCGAQVLKQDTRDHTMVRADGQVVTVPDFKGDYCNVCGEVILNAAEG